MKIDDLKGCFANVNDDLLLRENGLLYAENKELKQKLEKIKFLIEQSDIKNMLWGKEILEIIGESND